MILRIKALYKLGIMKEKEIENIENQKFLKGLRFLFGSKEPKLALKIFNSLESKMFIILCHRHKMIGPIYRDLSIIDLYFKHRNELLAAFKYQTKHTLGLLHNMKELNSCFKNNAIEVLIVKGPILSKKLYEDSCIRYSWDIDIYVDKHNVLQAYQTLANLGYKAKDESNFKNLESTLSYIGEVKNIELYKDDKKTCVELHWDLISNAVCCFSFQNPFLFSSETELYGEKYKVLSSEYELVYLILHASLHQWFRYQLIHDIYMYLNREEVNWKCVQEILHKQGYSVIWEHMILVLKYWYPKSSLVNSLNSKSCSWHHNLSSKFLYRISHQSLNKYELSSSSISQAYARYITQVFLFRFIINYRNGLIKSLRLAFLPPIPKDVNRIIKLPMIFYPLLYIIAFVKPIFRRAKAA